MAEEPKPECKHEWHRMSYGEKCSECGAVRPHSAATDIPPGMMDLEAARFWAGRGPQGQQSARKRFPYSIMGWRD